MRIHVDYMEARLDQPLEIDDIAKAALSSKYHFLRMFHALIGFTVTENVRNRRLTLAAEQLEGTDSKVIDVALQYGYESPEVLQVVSKIARRNAFRCKEKGCVAQVVSSNLLSHSD